MTSTYLHRVFISAISGATLLIAGMAGAAPSKFSDGKVAVVDANNFIDDARNGQYIWGGSLSMTVKATPEANRLGKLKLKARIFPMNAYEKLPSPWLTFDPCDIYYTMVVPQIRIGKRRTINLTSLNSIGWLVLADGKPAHGRFRIVFEAQSDNEPVFRLDRAQRGAYFARSLYIEVHSSGSGGGGQGRSEEQLRADRDRVLAIVKQNDPKWVCYRYETADSDVLAQTQLAGLERCDEAPSNNESTSQELPGR